MARPIEELVRPFQLGAAGQRIPVDPSLGTGRLQITVATIALDGQGLSLGGSGYVVDDTMFLAGGAGTAAILRVKDIDETGAILSVTIDSGGNYTIIPASPALQKLTSGTGQGSEFQVSANGENATVKITYGGVGKMPAPVSDVVGITICNEEYEEVPNTRQTNNVQINDNTGSGAFITVARTNKLTMKKSGQRNKLDSGVAALVDQTFSELSSDIQNRFEKADGGLENADKCNLNFNYHNPFP